MPRQCVLQTANCALWEQGLLRDDVKYQPGSISYALAGYKCVNFMSHAVFFSLEEEETGPTIVDWILFNLCSWHQSSLLKWLFHRNDDFRNLAPPKVRHLHSVNQICSLAYLSLWQKQTESLNLSCYNIHNKICYTVRQESQITNCVNATL